MHEKQRVKRKKKEKKIISGHDYKNAQLKFNAANCVEPRHQEKP